MMMTSHTAPDVRPVDDLAAELEGLHKLATMVLNAHTNAAGHCAACPESPFPCALAVLAEHNAALL
jgi:hypothetical protein